MTVDASLCRIRTYDHPLASPEFYHCAMGASSTITSVLQAYSPKHQTGTNQQQETPIEKSSQYQTTSAIFVVLLSPFVRFYLIRPIVGFRGCEICMTNEQSVFSEKSEHQCRLKKHQIELLADNNRICSLSYLSLLRVSLIVCVCFIVCFTCVNDSFMCYLCLLHV